MEFENRRPAAGPGIQIPAVLVVLAVPAALASLAASPLAAFVSLGLAAGTGWRQTEADTPAYYQMPAFADIDFFGFISFLLFMKTIQNMFWMYR